MLSPSTADSSSRSRVIDAARTKSDSLFKKAAHWTTCLIRASPIRFSMQRLASHLAAHFFRIHFCQKLYSQKKMRSEVCVDRLQSLRRNKERLSQSHNHRFEYERCSSIDDILKSDCVCTERKTKKLLSGASGSLIVNPLSCASVFMIPFTVLFPCPPFCRMRGGSCFEFLHSWKARISPESDR